MLVYILFSFILVTTLTNKELPYIRVEYYQSIDSESKTEKLLKDLKSVKNKSALLLAYQGASEALMAKHVWNPFKKMEWLNQSAETMRMAVSQHPNHPEIRFLRFSYEHYLPSFLNKSPHLEEDKHIIINSLKNKSSLVDMELKKKMASFLIETKRCLPDEILFLETFLLTS